MSKIQKLNSKNIKSIKLECGCKLHRIEITLWKWKGLTDVFADIAIVKHKSDNTGKLLKKMKLEADIVLYPKKLKQLQKFLNKNEK